MKPGKFFHHVAPGLTVPNETDVAEASTSPERSSAQGKFKRSEWVVEAEQKFPMEKMIETCGKYSVSILIRSVLLKLVKKFIFFSGNILIRHWKHYEFSTVSSKLSKFPIREASRFLLTKTRLSIGSKHGHVNCIRVLASWDWMGILVYFVQGGGSQAF